MLLSIRILTSDGIAETGGRLIDAVVHHLINQVVEPFLPGAPDIHGRPLPDRLQPFQYLDTVGTVIFLILFSLLLDFH